MSGLSPFFPGKGVKFDPHIVSIEPLSLFQLPDRKECKGNYYDFDGNLEKVIRNYKGGKELPGKHAGKACDKYENQAVKELSYEAARDDPEPEKAAFC